MLLKDHKDLKAAIIALPPKEKDALLLRLVAKDKVLTEHLHFKLLEEEADLEERYHALIEEIDTEIAALQKIRKAGAKDSLTVMRKLNGRVNHHFKVTKDLHTEIDLRLYLLSVIPVAYEDYSYLSMAKYAERLNAYFVKTTFGLYKKYLKLHEDLQFDLMDKFNQLLRKIEENNLQKIARIVGLPNEL